MQRMRLLLIALLLAVPVLFITGCHDPYYDDGRSYHRPPPPRGDNHRPMPPRDHRPSAPDHRPDGPRPPHSR